MKRFILFVILISISMFVSADEEKEDNTAVIKAVMQSVDADMKKGFAGRKQAIKKLEQLLTIDADCTEAYFKLAECYRRNNKKKKAVEYYNIVIDKIGDPTVGDLGMWYNQSIKYLDKLDPVSKQIRELNEQHVSGLKALYRRYKDQRIVYELVKLGVDVEHKQSVAGAVVYKMDTKKPWQDTGIKLQKGAMYLITAEGKWQYNIDKDEYLTAAGLLDVSKREGFTINSLLGKCNKTIFEIGVKKVYKASETGNLELQIHNTSFYNNKGTLTVTIRRLK